MSRIRVLCLLLTILSGVSVAASPLPPAARARLGTTDLWHGPIVHDLAFAPDGKTFFSLSSADPAARQWDAVTGAEVRAFAGHKGRLTAIALSSDGRQLATAGYDRTIRLWNTATGESIATWARKLTPTNVAFAPDSKTLGILPGDEFDSAAVLDAVSGKELHKIRVDAPLRLRGGGFNPLYRGDGRMEGTVVFSPDGRFLAVHASQMVTLWDTTSHKRVRHYEVLGRLLGGPGGGGFGGYYPGYVSLQFSVDSQTLFAASGDDGVRRWEITSVEPLEPLKTDDAGSVSVTKSAVAAAGYRGLTLWDGDGKRLHHLAADNAALTAVACSPDGKTAVTGDREGRLRVWDVATGKERVQPGLRPAFRTLAVTADAVVTGDEYALLRWDTVGKETKRFKLDTESLADLLLSPDGGTLAVRQTDGAVRLLDATTGETRATLAAKNRKLTTLQFSADGRWLAALDAPSVVGRGRSRTTTEASVLLYDTRSGKEVRQLAGSAPLGNDFVFLPEGRTLVTALSGDSVCLWETLTGKPRRVFPSAQMDRNLDSDDTAELLFGMGGMGPGGRLRGDPDERKFILKPQQLAVSPDGRTVAAVRRTSVSLVDLQTGKRLARLEGNMGTVSCVAYSPDGRLLVTGGNDQFVRLWDGVTGKEIGTLSGHRGPVRSAAFTPDGKTLVTAAEDRTALVWNVAEAVEVARQVNKSVPAPRPLAELWADLAGDDAERADAALRELESRPAETLPLLKERLRPASAADAKQVTNWVAELDGDDFTVREHAAAELEKVGEQARAALEAALRNKPSEELKRRVAELVKKLDERLFSPELVRELRVLEAVEKIGSAEAVKLLEALAAGAASDPRTQDAKAALERLTRK